MYLPRLHGPKIGPFQASESKFSIKFINKIGQGIHSIVWKVEINGRLYALKMFENYIVSDFISPMELDLLHDDGITDSEIMDSWDPFNNECRAYGRLDESNLTNIAARCYGYLFLRHELDDTSESEDLNESTWTRTENLERYGSAKKLPIRTIVKEYIDSDHPFTPEMVPKMLQNVKSLHKYGIVHRDLRADNYKNGLLVDFSSTLTVPHYLADIKFGYVRKEIIYDYEISDATGFDAMITEWNDENGTRIWHRFLPNRRYCVRLRSGQITAEDLNKYSYDKDIALLQAKVERSNRWHKEAQRWIKWHAADYDWERRKVNRAS